LINDVSPIEYFNRTCSDNVDVIQWRRACANNDRTIAEVFDLHLASQPLYIVGGKRVEGRLLSQEIRELLHS
jgi:hypothetical protein